MSSPGSNYDDPWTMLDHVARPPQHPALSIAQFGESSGLGPKVNPGYMGHHAFERSKPGSLGAEKVTSADTNAPEATPIKRHLPHFN